MIGVTVRIARRLGEVGGKGYLLSGFANTEHAGLVQIFHERVINGAILQ